MDRFINNKKNMGFENPGNQESNFNLDLLDDLESDLNAKEGFKNLAETINYAVMMENAVNQMREYASRGEIQKETVQKESKELRAAFEGYQTALSSLEAVKSNPNLGAEDEKYIQSLLDKNANTVIRIISHWSAGSDEAESYM